MSLEREDEREDQRARREDEREAHRAGREDDRELARDLREDIRAAARETAAIEAASLLHRIAQRYPTITSRLLVGAAVVVFGGFVSWLTSVYATVRSTSGAVAAIERDHQGFKEQNKERKDALDARLDQIGRDLGGLREDVRETQRDVKVLLREQGRPRPAATRDITREETQAR